MELFENVDAGAQIAEKQFIRDLKDGDQVDSYFIVREASSRAKKNGDKYLRLVLGDASGSVTAMVWENADELTVHCEAGSVVAAQGRYTEDPRYGPQVVIERAAPIPEAERDYAKLLEVTEHGFEPLVEELDKLIATVEDPYLRKLLEQLLTGDGEVATAYKTVPAAKIYHQAFRHGLLEHSVTVAKSVSQAAEIFPGINRDLAVAGALLHDIGKTVGYEDDPLKYDLTDLGRLHGEIPLGYYTVRRQIEGIDGFPDELAVCLLHIILAHHGTKEQGSPVVPATREAVLVHMMDNLGGTLGSFDRIEKQLNEGELWSQFDRALSAQAYFGGR